MSQTQEEIDTCLIWIAQQISIRKRLQIEILYINSIVEVEPSHVTILGEEFRFTVTFHMHDNTRREICEARHYKKTSDWITLPGRAITIWNSQCLSARPTQKDDFFHIRINPKIPYRF